MGELRVVVDLPEGTDLRADRYIAEQGLFPRSQFRQRRLTISHKGRELKFSRPVRNGMILDMSWEDPPPPDIRPEPVPLDILYEDDHVLVVNKPQGMVVHPANGNWTGTLVQGLLHHCLSYGDNFNGDLLRPGIVHRLDKDTSGVMITAKDPASLEELAAQFRERETRKEYLAFVRGRPPADRGTIRTGIERDPADRKRFRAHTDRGKPSITRYRLLWTSGDMSYLRIGIETGRTHQIRVHMKHLGCPVLGDPVYGGRSSGGSGNTLMLHAWRLTVRLPGDSRPRTFRAPLPGRFRRLIAGLSG